MVLVKKNGSFSNTAVSRCEREQGFLKVSIIFESCFALRYVVIEEEMGENECIFPKLSGTDILCNSSSFYT